LRFLLDEMYPHAIAEGLRRRGHDAIAVTERADLRTLPDGDLVAVAQGERRAVVTENVADFAPLADSHDARGTGHFGLILVPAGTYPRGPPRTIGHMVSALDGLAGRYPVDQPTSLRHWL
jgi:hypothetical protein